jgi:hypothetical protein
MFTSQAGGWRVIRVIGVAKNQGTAGLESRRASTEKSALFEHRKEVRHPTFLVVERKMGPVLG